jgi:glycosyltransferase involved in cell wall biosynthesis
MIGRLLAVITLAGSYALALGISRGARRVRPTRVGGIRRIALVGRFDNRGWFDAHVRPLCGLDLDEIVVIADAALPAGPPVRFSPPPRWLRPAGRAAGKFATLLVAAVRRNPDLFVGFHLFPGAITALIVARLAGRPVCYQMTGGELEVLDGGAGCENPVMARLGRRSAVVERLALKVVREFDLVVVRGSRAQAYLRAHGIGETVTVNTASVPSLSGHHGREYDLIFVGRLAPIKQPDQFVEIVSRVRTRRPQLRAVMVGDGPLLPGLRALAAARGLESTIAMLGQRTDTHELLARSRVFVLTSRSEGLPIAAAEAMAAGVVPVAANVGEMASLVTDGVSGFLIEPNDREAFAERILALLDDEDLRASMSRAASDAACRVAGLDAVKARWRKDLARLAGESKERGDEPAAAGAVALRTPR